MFWSLHRRNETYDDFCWDAPSAGDSAPYPDRRSVEAALQRIGYTVRATGDHAVSEVLLHSFRPLLMISDAIDLFLWSVP